VAALAPATRTIYPIGIRSPETRGRPRSRV